MSSTLRILDAAANRAREALRVLEDAARFGRDDGAATAQLKALRHDLAAALAFLPMDRARQERDTPGDVGTTVKTEAEFTRGTVLDILSANAKRLTEALRSLEEFAKLENVSAAAQLEKLRYRAYALEQSVLAAAHAADAVERFGLVRLYVLLTESICVRPWEETLNAILAAAPAARGRTSPLCIQLREKALADGDLLRRARHVVARCHGAGVLVIMNDRPDIALLAGADGVHVGQTDLSIADCRRILGPEVIVGISTESLEQARAAERAGATYVAVGPMFATTTKEKPRIAGPDYAAAAAREIKRPLVAIGGITVQNAAVVRRAGISCLAVSSAILRAPEPAKVIAAILDENG